MLENVIKGLIQEAQSHPINDQEADRLMALILHDVAVGSEAARHPWVTGILDHEEDALGEEGYTLFGRKEKSSSFDLAVQHNAMAITASICEDFVKGTHPGAVIFPLLLAESEKEKYAADRLLISAAVGLQMAQLLNFHFGKPLADKGFRATTLVGAMAGAAALAWLREESEEAALQAMAVAASSASGFAFPFHAGTEEWPIQVGVAAHTASIACRIAKTLHFYNDRFLSGEHSFGKMLDVLPLQEESGKYSVMEIGVKRHPVNSFVQSVIEALLRLEDVDVSQVEGIRVQVPPGYQAMPVLMNKGPFEKTNLALLSIPVSGALALTFKRMKFEDLRRANDREILDLAGRFEIVIDEDLKDYDTIVMVKEKEKEWQSQVKSSCFYPSLAEELSWIREQKGETLEWVEYYRNLWDMKI